MTVLLRGFRSDDLEAVLDLRERVFDGLDRERERRRWCWQFDANPCRPPGVPRTWVVEEGGRILGNFGMIPYRMKIGDLIGLALDGIDLAMHPDAQGRGLARMLADAFVDPAHSDFPFVSAPTGATTHLLVTRGGTVFGAEGEVITFVRQFDPAGSAPEQADEGGVIRLAGFDERADGLWEELAPGLPLAVVRDAAYLNWRYRDYPFQECELLAAVAADGSLDGIAILQHDPPLSRTYLHELLFRPGDPDTADRLLAQVCTTAHLNGLPQLACVSRETSIRDALVRHGFAPLGEPIPTYIGRINGDHPGVEIDRWTLSLGDGDALFSVGA